PVRVQDPCSRGRHQALYVTPPGGWVPALPNIRKTLHPRRIAVVIPPAQGYFTAALLFARFRQTVKCVVFVIGDGSSAILAFGQKVALVVGQLGDPAAGN